MSQDITEEQCLKLLRDFESKWPDIKGSIVMAYPAGVPIAGTWKEALDPVLVGAISASMKITFQHLCTLLKKGYLYRLFVNSENGKAVIQNAGPNILLTTIVNYDTDIAQVAFTTNDLVKKLARLLQNYKI